MQSSTFSRARPLHEPVLAHIHVPKCAGTSFRKMLDDHFGAGHLALYVDDTFFVYPVEELASRLADRTIRALSSHFVRSFPPRLGNRDMLYISFLRDPVEHFVSYLTYVRKHFANIRDQNLLRCLPPGLPSLSLREAARWILTCPREVHFRNNYAVDFFARFAVRVPWYLRLSSRYYRRVRLDTAKQVLDQFFFVGVVEQMERSVSVLRELARRNSIEFPSGAITVENTSFEGRGDLSWIRADDEVGALLFRSIREDQELYNAAVRRLELTERDMREH